MPRSRRVGGTGGRLPRSRRRDISHFPEESGEIATLACVCSAPEVRKTQPGRWPAVPYAPRTERMQHAGRPRGVRGTFPGS